MMYVELHCHSYFSLLDGASSPEELVARAAELGMPTLALTDHDGVYGAVRFAEAAQAAGIRPLFGAELSLSDGHHLTLLVENQAGWANLCRLISQARHNARKGAAALPPTALEGHTAGLIALSGCSGGEVPAALLRRDQAAALTAGCRYRDLFGPDRFWLELQHHLRPEAGRLVAELVELAEQLGLGYVATNNVHYATRAGCRLQDILVCIRHQTTLDQAGPLLRPNSEYYLKSARQLAPLFAVYPKALSNSYRIAERCQFELRYGLQTLPQFLTPAGLSTGDYLRQLCQAAYQTHYPQLPERAQAQLSHELAVIEQAGLSNYFLIVWDLVRFAQENNIRGQGRGSAANSLVAYLLGLSPIDPLTHNLVFERFLSGERQGGPDIDLDFETQRREEVIQYVYQKYGPEHTAMACTFVTFRRRSALRDIGKVLGLPPEVLAAAAQALETDERPEPLAELLDLCRQLQGCPRHLGIHAGGMVVTGSPLIECIPTEPATMVNRVVVQWDKESLEAAGLVKIDLLGLRMLSAISDTLALIKESSGVSLDLKHLDFADPEIYRMIARADTIGVFQVESRAQAQLLPRLQPRCFNDLIIAISLIRPGPIQGNMVHPYLRRRAGLEPITYLHPSLEPALAETLGVILFQEQVLKVAACLAGFTLGQGEQLRRALGAGGVEPFRQAFLAGAQTRRVPLAVAEAVFEQLRAFGSYAFAKSHATAFAVVVYQSALLKRYHPVEFLAGLLNNQPLGFWNPAVLLGDARRHGLEVLGVDLNRSQGRCTVEAGRARLGFNYVSGLGEASITKLVEVRTARTFSGLADFCRRTRLPRRLIENLVLAGAMDSWGRPRRQLLWELGQLHYAEEELDLVLSDEGVSLPPLTPAEATELEQAVLGLSTGEHVMTFYCSWLNEQGILGSRDLKLQPDGAMVRVAGLVVVHQSPPTAKGFHFITLEDEAGLIDLIVRPQVYTRYRRLLRNEPLLVAEGTLQQQAGVTNLLVERLTPLPRL
ncbi:MAG: error-prone DNA polymerase [Chloroflexota bacterium]